MTWTDAARAAAAAARMAHGSGTKKATTIANNLGRKGTVVAAASSFKTKAQAALTQHIMMMNLTRGGYSAANRQKLAQLKTAVAKAKK